MSRYAKINSDNIVENIIVCDDSVVSVLDGTYIKVTESTRDAEIGRTYNPEHNKFIAKKLWDSWVFNEEKLQYEAPVQKPSSGEWVWKEDTTEWIEVIPGELEE
jgi:hypothetical protein